MYYYSIFEYFSSLTIHRCYNNKYICIYIYTNRCVDCRAGFSYFTAIRGLKMTYYMCERATAVEAIGGNTLKRK